MRLVQATFLLSAIASFCSAGDADKDHNSQLHHHHPHVIDRDVPSPIPVMKTGLEAVKPPKEYETKQMNIIESRDQGCTEFPDRHAEAFGCVNIWLKNRFSVAGIAPSQVMTEFKYHGTENSYRSVVTWVEQITPTYVRACAASVPGKANVLDGGKIKWLALYNFTQSNVEQSGNILSSQLTNLKSFTAAKHCFSVAFPTPFARAPTLKFTLKLKYGYHSAQDAMVIWAKGITSGSAVVCFEEFHAWARYHHDYELQWYGIATNSLNVADNYAQNGIISFGANDILPQNHNDLYGYYCKVINLARRYSPCPTILLQGVEPSLETCESPVSAWISYLSDTQVRVCYADRRGMVSQRKTEVQVHYIIYGSPNKCASACDMTDTAEVCGSNMKNYVNRCTLDKEACESGNKFAYAHKGKCEKNTIGHGRQRLSAVSTCQGLYCAEISTHNHVWYKDAKLNVQITTSWDSQNSHGPSASWVENVTGNKFKACVMQPGRASKTVGPVIQWFAYQGEVDEVKTHRIEVGDWQSGTHCVPVHERKPMQEHHQFHPDVCPKISLKDVGKVDQDKWQYDAHLMSQVYGQHHNEWFKRMLMGYGVKKLNLTSGMVLNGTTFMMTVEHTHKESQSMGNDVRDAVNVWMEYDERTHESYVCLREMQNWDGKHKGIHVHWTMFNNTMVRNLGISHKVMFKPTATPAGGFDHGKALCQTKAFLPAGMDLINGATALASITHRIKPYNSMDSMKKYQLHQQQVMMGMSIGEADMTRNDVKASWMMPHMWRANLTGWRPHMRIEKDTDYSAWIEAMNTTHLTVCQKSTHNGQVHEAVAVNLFILPDRCPAGYTLLDNNMCGRHIAACASVQNAANQCASEGAVLAAPQNCHAAVHVSYLAGQVDVHIAKTDASVEGQWGVGYGVPQPATNWFNWAAGNPTAGPNDRDCAYQSGMSRDFKEYEQTCDTCRQYVCVKPTPWLACGFRKPGFCNECGTCNKLARYSFRCDCIPPYTGTHCELRRPQADQ